MIKVSPIRTALLVVPAFIGLLQAAHITYVYPAGGQCGSTFDITIGGQDIRSPQAVYISTAGAKATIIEYIPPIRPLRDNDRTLFRQRLNAIRKSFKYGQTEPLNKEQISNLKAQLPVYPEDSLLRHPYVRDMESLNPAELDELAKKFLGQIRTEPQFAAAVKVRVAIHKNVRPGMYEIRLSTQSGLSNPLVFHIDAINEVVERESNDEKNNLAPVSVPFIMNGQIMPGDIDNFSFEAIEGQKLIIQTYARSLMPYLADAVPGWFQAVMYLYDNDTELAYCDDYLFNPDPVIFFDVPKSGIYRLKIHDSIYRGREDFVYRVSVSEKPFVTSMFPLGTEPGSKYIAKITGWNLPGENLELNALSGGSSSLRYAQIKNNGLYSDAIPFAVDRIPQVFEKQPNNTIETAQKVQIPIVINGIISLPNESDFFSFAGKSEQEIVIEVNSRRLASPLDSAIELIDATGKIIDFNDDFTDASTGLLTHHADSYLKTKLPADGIYTVRIFDITASSGEQYGYRLRISEPMPQYELRLTPSGINIPAGQTAALLVNVIKKDGFNDDIVLSLSSSPKANYTLSGNGIPADKDSIYITVTAPENIKTPSELTIESRARTRGGIVSKTAIASENMMQAFIYEHLVPMGELIVVPKEQRFPPLAFNSSLNEVKVCPGQNFELKFTARRNVNLQNRNIEASLLTETDKIEINKVSITQNQIGITVGVSKECPIGYKDNIVIKLSQIVERKRPDGSIQSQSVSLNDLPAVVLEIISNKDTK